MNTPQVNDVVRFLHNGIEKRGQVVAIGPEFAAIDTQDSHGDAIIPVANILANNGTTAPWEISRAVHNTPAPKVGFWQRLRNLFN